MFTEELEYNNSIIQLQNKQIDNIFLMIETQELPEGVIWDSFFIYKYIASIKLLDNDDNIIYATNGLYFKSKSDLKMESSNPLKIKNLDDMYQLKKIGEEKRRFFIPMIDKRSFVIDKNNLRLDIQINKNITTPLLKNPPIQLKIVTSYGAELPTVQTDNDYIPMCHRIEIPKKVSELHYSVDLVGISKGFFFYNDGEFSITNVQLIFDNTSQSYSFNQLSTILPYLHLSKMPDNDRYLYIPFMTNHQSYGLDLGKLGTITITFSLYCNNNGGNIYLFSELRDINSNQIRMDKWIYEKDMIEFHTEEEFNDNDIIINVSI